ncbi:MAG: two component transcriptional regulator, winged helix family [Myxococcales bacterium]|nr:two component transcriptional regulator, winged helix family [Myxococcales bacterium]
MSGTQATLLVVDDEPEINKLVARIFEKRGYVVHTAADGAEALAQVASKHPDLIILDLNIPKIDGWEVCRRLKSDAATSKIPIIMLTAAHANVDDAHIGLGLGADEYVAKPFVKAVLLYNVERLLGRPHSEDSDSTEGDPK